MTQTVITHWHTHNRVSFSHSEGDFGLEDLELLEAAIKHARRRIEQSGSTLVDVADELSIQPTLGQLYAEQLERQAAPT